MTRDYAYFIENRLRARYGLDGVPLVIDFNERRERRGGRSPPGVGAGLATELQKAGSIALRDLVVTTSIEP